MWFSWTLRFIVSHKAVINVSTRAGGSSEGSTGEISAGGFFAHCCWQNLVPCGKLDWEAHFLAAYWPETTLSSLPHGPLQYCDLLHQHVQVEKALKRVCQKDGNHNLMWPNHRSDTLLPLLYSAGWKQVRGPAHTQEEGMILGCEYRR